VSPTIQMSVALLPQRLLRLAPTGDVWTHQSAVQLAPPSPPDVLPLLLPLVLPLPLPLVLPPLLPLVLPLLPPLVLPLLALPLLLPLPLPLLVVPLLEPPLLPDVLPLPLLGPPSSPLVVCEPVPPQAAAAHSTASSSPASRITVRRTARPRDRFSVKPRAVRAAGRDCVTAGVTMLRSPVATGPALLPSR
jgi:signal-induced proliferation-associated 1 like protein 3